MFSLLVMRKKQAIYSMYRSRPQVFIEHLVYAEHYVLGRKQTETLSLGRAYSPRSKERSKMPGGQRVVCAVEKNTARMG